MKAVTLREMTTTEGAAACGVTRTHLRECLRGQPGGRVPSLELAQRIADFVGVPLAKFWAGNLPQDAMKRQRAARRAARAEASIP